MKLQSISNNSRYLFIIIILLAITIPSTLQQNSVTDNLIHHYPFDGNLKHTENLSLTATPSSTTSFDTVNDRKSQSQRAISLSDPNSIQYLELPVSLLNNLNSFTITLWVKQNTVSTRDQTFLSVASTAFENELLINKSELYFKHNSSNDSPTTKVSFTNIYSDTTTWHQIAIVRDQVNGSIDLYLNGNLHASLTGTSTDPLNAEGIVIGNNQGSVLGGWDVSTQLDSSFMDFRIYDSTKTASQIQDIYNFFWCREFEVPNLGQSSCICASHSFINSSNNECEDCPERYTSCTDYSTPDSCQGTNRKPLGDDCICQENFYEDPDSINCIPVVDPVTDALIHYYPFDGRMDNLIDPTKPAYAGPGAIINTVPGRFDLPNEAYGMDDARIQVLKIPASTMNNLKSFTVSMWVKSNKSWGSQGYFSVANTERDNEILIYKHIAYFYHGKSGGATGNFVLEYPSISTDTTWKHITFVRDQPYGIVQIYVDGVLQSTLTGTSMEKIKSEEIIIGNDQDSVDGGYEAGAQIHGSFAQLRIYNVAKSASEILQIKEYMVCQSGEYPDQTLGCQTCPDRYTECQDANTAISCNSGANRKNSSENCLCFDRHYEDPLSDDCLECPERYGSCSNISTPLTCRGTNRKDTSQDCQCLDHYYEDPITENCLECPERYGNCSNNTTPLTCQGTGRKNLSQDCVCLDRHYEDTLSINCLQCHERYGECTAVSIPTSCQGTNRKAKEEDCICLDHFYEDPLTVNCLECPERYGSCSDDSTPINCQGSGRKDTSQDCVCLDRYFEDSGSINCLECPERYGSCSDNSTPITCQGTRRKNLSQDCVCLDRHYEDPLSINCLQCHERYGECTAVSTPTSCQGTNRKPKEQDCLCLDHFYEDPLTINCLECPERYGNCSDNTTPITCQGSGRQDTSQDCVCLDRYFEDSGSINCLECPERYGSCSDSTTPISCQGDNRKSKENDCICQEGYYEDPSSINCVKCPSNFETCTDENTPLSCQGKNRKGLSYNCTCIDGFFDNPINSDCLSCEYPCECTPNPQKCGTCLSHPDECIISCHETCAQCNSEGDCITCKLGQYLNNGRCEDCNSKCEICNPNNKNQCLVCKDQNDIGRSLDISNQCGCLDGYFENPSTFQCDKCQNDKCKQCDQTGTICQECLDENLIPPLCKLNKKGNFYITDSEGEQKPGKCDTKCETCENSSDNCLSCIHGLHRYQYLPCLCEDGYHDNSGQNNDCQKCPKYCLKCESSEQCSQCEEGRHLNTFSGQCECSYGYKENELKQCVKCYQFKGKCLLVCPPNTKIIEEEQICELHSDLSFSSYTSQIWICSGIILALLIASTLTFLLSFKKNKNPTLKQSRIQGIAKNLGY